VGKRGRLVIAGVIAVAALTGIVVLAVRLLRPSDNDVVTGPFALGQVRPASSSDFRQFYETDVALDGTCLRVLLARSGAQQFFGLRDVQSVAPYDGMLFEFPSAHTGSFTMARVHIPLDIGWYESDGTRIDTARMEPCPEGTDADCPTYSSDGPYRYALETPAGQLGSGSLGTCSA
jgi:uncharacterized membrane protein (UPF0127 family)